MTHHSLFVAIEGIDGSGGTTQTKMLVDWLTARGPRPVHQTCEPSDNPVGRFIRRALQPGTEESSVSDAVLPFLFAADRRDHLDREIVPTLQQGGVVVTDRYYHSSLAYQSMAIGLAAVAALNQDFLPPDLTVVLSLDVEVCLGRVTARGAAVERFEAMDRLRKVQDAYESVILHCRTNGENVVKIDASGTPDEVHALIRAEVEKLL